ncbi:zf-HC2 domain-containing protein [Actinomadura sp. 7K507]|uniref:anti-sigma factor family protein n=1 Tax=Actinomadura sp. 7K507 TaxID=2530365 RepID=UPI001043EDBA|nr:zf-HC2 domain-containing protein [Actinomadura sp. 7K507]TDC75356.1 zf-HC2 domain-containing protein [Actinomadura sp. 7K507]
MNPAHLDYDVLADLAEGLLEDDEAASVNAHLDTCADCRDLSADLADVSRILAEAPAPSIPAELAERIDTAIAAESLNNATVVSMEQRRGRRHWRTLSAAAAAVIVVGGGAAVGSIALDGASSNDGSTAAPAQDQSHERTNDVDPKVAAPEGAPAFKVHSSGTEYRAGDLGSQVSEFMNERRTGPGVTTAGPHLRSCVYAVTQGKAPELVDEALYEGTPANVIVARGDEPGKWNVWVVGTECTANDQHVLKTLENA